MKRNLVTWFSTLLVASAAWWALLGWDTQRNSDGTGPYAAWQVVVFVLVLIALAVWAGLRRSPLVSSIVLAVAATVNWSVSATSTDDSGLWAVGALFVLVGSLAGGLVVSYLVTSVAERR